MKSLSTLLTCISHLIHLISLLFPRSISSNTNSSNVFPHESPLSLVLSGGLTSAARILSICKFVSVKQSEAANQRFKHLVSFVKSLRACSQIHSASSNWFWIGFNCTTPDCWKCFSKNVDIGAHVLLAWTSLTAWRQDPWLKHIPPTPSLLQFVQWAATAVATADSLVR